MSAVIYDFNDSLEKRRNEELESLEGKIFDENSSFTYWLDPVFASALFFINDYVFSNNSENDSERIIDSQIMISQYVVDSFKEKRICFEKNFFRRKKACRDDFVLTINKIFNVDYFNRAASENSNKGFGQREILDDVLEVYISLFLQQINGENNYGIFPDIQTARKGALKKGNALLYKILSDIDREGLKVDFLPSSSTNGEYNLVLFK